MMKNTILLFILLLSYSKVFCQKAELVKDLNKIANSETEYEIIPKLGLDFSNRYYFISERVSDNGDPNSLFKKSEYLLCAIDSAKKDVKVVSSILPNFGDLYKTNNHLFILLQKKNIYISDGSSNGTFDIRKLMKNTNYASRLDAGASIEKIYSIKNKLYIHLRINSQLSEIYVCDGSITGSKFLSSANTSIEQVQIINTDEYFIIAEYNSALKFYHYSNDQAIISPNTYLSYLQITPFSTSVIYFSTITNGSNSLYKYNLASNQITLIRHSASTFKIWTSSSDTIIFQTYYNQSSELNITDGTTNGTKTILTQQKVWDAIFKNGVILALYQDLNGSSGNKVGRFNLNVDTLFKQVFLPSNTNWPSGIFLSNTTMLIQADELSSSYDRTHLFEYTNGDSAKLYAKNQGGNIIQKLKIGSNFLVKMIRYQSNIRNYYWAIADSSLKTSTELNFFYNGNNFSLLINDLFDDAHLIDGIVYIRTAQFGYMSFDQNNPSLIRPIGLQENSQKALNKIYVNSNKLYEITANPIDIVTSINKSSNSSSFPEYIFQNDSLIYFSIFESRISSIEVKRGLYQLNTKTDNFTKVLNKNFYSGGVNSNGYYYGFMYDDSTRKSFFAKTNGTITGTIKLKELIGSSAQDIIIVNNKIYFDDCIKNTQQQVSLWVYDINANTTVKINAGEGQIRYTNKNRKVVINDNMYVLNSFAGPITRISLINNSSITIPAPFGVDTIRQIFKDGNNLFIVGEDRTYRLADGQTNAVLHCSILTSPSQSITNYVMVGNTFYFSTTSNKLYKNDGTSTNSLLYSSTRPINKLLTLNGKVYFVGTDNNYGAELWSTNGTVQETKIVSDINNGYESSDPSDFYAYNNKIYYNASSSKYGKEFYELNTQTNINRLLYDINTGPNSSYPFTINNINNKFYLNCFTNVGFELWKLELVKIHCNIAFEENCYNNQVIFKIKLNNSLDSIINQKWYYGNNLYSEDSSITAEVLENDSLTIKLIVQNINNLIDTINYIYVKRENIESNFTINDSTQCLENNQFVFELDTLNKIYKNIKWDLGDSTTIFNNSKIEHTYTNPGNYTIKLIVEEEDNPCIDTIIKNIVINQNPADEIIGEDSVKGNETYTYQIPYDSNYKYQWIINTNLATIIGRDDSNIVNIRFNDNDIITWIQVISEDSFGCIEEIYDTIVVKKSVGINKILGHEINVYPVPTSDYIYIDSYDKIQRVRIVDLLGKVVYQSIGNSSSISLLNLNSGLYILEIDIEGNTIRKQIIKNQ